MSRFTLSDYLLFEDSEEDSESLFVPMSSRRRSSSNMKRTSAEMDVKTDVKTEDEPPLKRQKVLSEEEAVARMLKDDEFTDATIKCGGRTWKVHKVELAKKSEYFYNSFRKSSGFKEGETSVVDLGDNEVPASIDALLQYVYHPSTIPTVNSRPPTTKNEDHIDRVIKYNLDAVRLADYFAMPSFHETAMSNLSAVLLSPNNFAIIDNEGRFGMGMKLSTFCDIARHLTEYPNEAIRSRWVFMAARNWAILRTHAACGEFQELVKELPGFCVDIVDLLHKDKGWQVKFSKTPRLAKTLAEYTRVEPEDPLKRAG